MSVGTIRETRHPSEGVTMNYTVEVIDGEKLDTAVSLNGRFAITGECRREFEEKLGSLIDEYRI